MIKDNLDTRDLPTSAGTPCISDATAKQLVKLVLRAEELFGCPQDVEWAVANGEEHVLQSRPITALPDADVPCPEDRQVWSNVNFGEIVPDVMTPMTFLRRTNPL